MKIKTSELIGPALDWAVAKCEYAIKRHKYGTPTFNPKTNRVYETEGLQQIGVNFRPSTDWAQGGPIIEREHLHLGHNSKEHPDTCWQAAKLGTQPWGVNEFGPTPLIAAMRCRVASLLGELVDIPDELIV